MSENRFLVSCWEMEEEEEKWRMGECMSCCNMNEENGMAQFHFGIWKLRGLNTVVDRGSCPLCRRKGNVLYKLEVYGWEKNKGKMF
jgi:hypothetical protein